MLRVCECVGVCGCVRETEQRATIVSLALLLLKDHAVSLLLLLITWLAWVLVACASPLVCVGGAHGTLPALHHSTTLHTRSSARTPHCDPAKNDDQQRARPKRTIDGAEALRSMGGASKKDQHGSNDDVLKRVLLGHGVVFTVLECVECTSGDTHLYITHT
jgi:hypothetical protein